MTSKENSPRDEGIKICPDKPPKNRDEAATGWPSSSARRPLAPRPTCAQYPPEDPDDDEEEMDTMPTLALKTEISPQRQAKRARNIASRHRCDDKKKSKKSDLLNRKGQLETKLKNLKNANLAPFENCEKWILEEDDFNEETRQILKFELEKSRSDVNTAKDKILMRVRRREEDSLKKLKENLHACRRRFDQNELRKFLVPESTYRPQLCRTKKDIELAEIALEVKNLEIEVEVEEGDAGRANVLH